MVLPKKRKPADDEDDDSPSKLPVLLSIFAVLALGVGCVWFFFIRPGGADVSGKVTLDGELVTGANVAFLPEGEKGQIVARTSAKGEYRLIGNDGPRIPPGKYKVAVSKEALKDGTVPEGEKLEQARTAGMLVNILPSKYEHIETTPLSYDIRSGGNKIHIELTKQ